MKNEVFYELFEEWEIIISIISFPGGLKHCDFGEDAIYVKSSPKEYHNDVVNRKLFMYKGSLMDGPQFTKVLKDAVGMIPNRYRIHEFYEKVKTDRAIRSAVYNFCDMAYCRNFDSEHLLKLSSLLGDKIFQLLIKMVSFIDDLWIVCEGTTFDTEECLLPFFDFIHNTLLPFYHEFKNEEELFDIDTISSFELIDEKARVIDEALYQIMTDDIAKLQMIDRIKKDNSLYKTCMLVYNEMRQINKKEIVSFHEAIYHNDYDKDEASLFMSRNWNLLSLFCNIVEWWDEINDFLWHCITEESVTKAKEENIESLLKSYYKDDFDINGFIKNIEACKNNKQLKIIISGSKDQLKMQFTKTDLSTPEYIEALRPHIKYTKGISLTNLQEQIRNACF